MVLAPPRPPMQRSLIPELQGDPRLLEPGYAGELSQSEFAFIQDQLLRDKRLARLWGFRRSARRRPETAIRALAERGDPSSGRANVQLARRPSSGMA